MGEQSELNKSIERIKGWLGVAGNEKNSYARGVAYGIGLCLEELKKLAKQEEVACQSTQ